MKNFVQPGRTIDFVNATGSTILAGTPVVIGNQVAILTDDVADGATGAADAEGVFSCPLKASLAITKGDRVFWSASTGKVTKTDSDTPMGIAWEDQASNDPTVNVKLLPASTSGVAADVAALTGTLTGTVDGALVDVAATAAATAGGSTPTAAQVDTGIALAVSTIVTGINTQNKEFQTAINAILTALKNAGLMA